MKVKICKFLLATIGKILPLRRRPGGKLANAIRCLITKGIVKSFGEHCIVERGAEVLEECIFGDYTSIGPDCLIGKGTVFKGHSFMGPNVHIYSSNHHYDTITHMFRGMDATNPVHIGENVWIGYGTVILPGVTIGDSVIIGASSVVTKDIPSGVMAAGNPCEVKKIIDVEIYERASLCK